MYLIPVGANTCFTYVCLRWPPPAPPSTKTKYDCLIDTAEEKAQAASQSNETPPPSACLSSKRKFALSPL